MDREQYTIVKDGALYHTDHETAELLRVARQYDATSTHRPTEDRRYLTDAVFDHARASQRIVEGPAQAHQLEQRQEPGHGYSR